MQLTVLSVVLEEVSPLEAKISELINRAFPTANRGSDGGSNLFSSQKEGIRNDSADRRQYTNENPPILSQLKNSQFTEITERDHLSYNPSPGSIENKTHKSASMRMTHREIDFKKEFDRLTYSIEKQEETLVILKYKKQC